MSVAVRVPVGCFTNKLNPITDNIMNRLHQKMSLEQKIQTLKLLLHMTLTILKSRTTFKGLNPIASECVLTALRRRHLATA